MAYPYGPYPHYYYGYPGDFLYDQNSPGMTVSTQNQGSTVTSCSTTSITCSSAMERRQTTSPVNTVTMIEPIICDSVETTPKSTQVRLVSVYNGSEKFA